MTSGANKFNPQYQLSQPQLDAIVPVLNMRMEGKLRTKKQFHAEIRNVCEKAKCPIPDDVDMNTVFM